MSFEWLCRNSQHSSDSNICMNALLNANEHTALFLASVWAATELLNNQEAYLSNGWVEEIEVQNLLASTFSAVLLVANQFEQRRNFYKQFVNNYLANPMKVLGLIMPFLLDENRNLHIALLLKLLQIQISHNDGQQLLPIIQPHSIAIPQMVLIAAKNFDKFGVSVLDAFDSLKIRVSSEEILKKYQETPNFSIIYCIGKHKQEIYGDSTQLQKVLCKQKKHHEISACDGLLGVALNTSTPIKQAISLFRLITVSNEKVAKNCSQVFGNLLSDEKQKSFSEDEIDLMGELVKHSIVDGKLGLPLAIILQSFNSKYNQLTAAVISAICPKLFDSLSCDDKVELIDGLLNVACTNSDAECTHLCKKILFTLEIDFNLWKSLILEEKQSNEVQKTNSRKRKRSVEAFSVGGVKWGILMEYAQTRDHLRTKNIVPLMFNILRRVQTLPELENKDQIFHTVLSILCDTCSDEVLSTLSPNDFGVDCIVKVLQLCTSLSTVHLALSLIILAARQYRNDVLMHIISIFTFMGSNIMAKDDAFTIKVVHDTIATVIPALAMSDETSDLIDLLRIICACVFDVPDHRRLSLISVLLKAAGDNSLWMFVSLLLEKLVLDWQKEKEHSQNLDLKYILAASERSGLTSREEELCFDIVSETNGISQLKCVSQLYSYCGTIEQPCSTGAIAIVNFEAFNQNQKRHFTYALYSLTYDVIASQQLLQKLSDLSPSDMRNEVVPVAQELSQSLLQIVNDIHERNIKDKNKMTPTNKFWSVVVKKCNSTLLKLHSLLPAETNLHVIEGLLIKEDTNNRNNAMQMLNSLLLMKPTPFTVKHVPLLSQILIVVGGWLSSENTVNINLLQQATYTLKLLAHIIAPFESKALEIIVGKVVKRLEDWSKDDAFVVGGLVTHLSQSLLSLKSKLLPHIQKSINITIEILKSDDIQKRNPLAAIACVTFFVRCVEILKQLVSPQLPIIFTQISFTAANAKLIERLEALDCNYKNVFMSRVAHFRKQAANLDTRVLLPAVSQAYVSISQQSPISVHHLFTILNEHAKKQAAKGVSAHFGLWNETFMNLIEFRSSYNKISIHDANSTEDALLQSICQFVLKLSEKNVRPLIFSLTEWAERAGHSANKSPKRLNFITFFRLMTLLANQLKSLFPLFAGRVFSLACHILDSENYCNEDKEGILDGRSPEVQSNADLLLQATITTLAKCFTFDKTHFVNEERFALVLEPLVNQLVNSELLGYSERVLSCVGPCIAELIANADNDSLCKEANYKILLHTRNEKALIRKYALLVAGTVYTRIGDRCSVLLPETVPFLSELMQDESQEVEAACHDVIRIIENNIPQESIAEYL